MMLQLLSRIVEFADAHPAEIRALARRVRVNCMPSGRWLVQDGRELGAYLYLVKGQVATRGPERHLWAKPFGKLAHFYPGCRAAKTLSAAQVLVINADERDFLLARVPPRPAIDQPAAGWLAAFLNSQMMAELRPAQWQRLLAGFEARQYLRGEDVVSLNDAAAQCFVLEKGHAVVHRGTKTLAHLGPGDFFGEDALILNCGRTASVTCLTPVLAHAIPRDMFLNCLLKHLVQPVHEPGSGTVLNLGQCEWPGSQYITLAEMRERVGALDPRARYFVVGGSDAQRYLAALILKQRGLAAAPVIHPYEIGS